MQRTDEIDRRARIEALPRLKFVWERDWTRGPFRYRAGFMWKKDIDAGAGEGEMAYSRWFFIVLNFRLLIDRSP